MTTARAAIAAYRAARRRTERAQRAYRFLTLARLDRLAEELRGAEAAELTAARALDDAIRTERLVRRMAP